MDKSKEKNQGNRLQSSHISQNSSYNIISHSRNLSHIMERTSLIAVYVFFIVLDIVVYRGVCHCILILKYKQLYK